MRVAYVLYNERPASGLVRTQVVTLLHEIRRQAPEIDITVIAFWQPWVARRFASQIAALRDDLQRSQIRLHSSAAAVVPSRHFMFRAELFPLLSAWGRAIFGAALRQRYDIVHCRSYFASLTAAALKPRFGHRVIFDMRSMFVKEHVTVGKWATGDRHYRMWERLEAKTIAASDVSIGVSQGMIDEVRAIDPRARAELIPLFSDQRLLRFDPDARADVRRERGWGNRLVVAYVGSLGYGWQWNNIGNYADGFELLRRVRPDAHFLVLTGNTQIARDALRARGLSTDAFTVTESPVHELRHWLSAADAGIHVMSMGPDSHTRLGVKVIEYLSCGLPVIVNRGVGAAADLVETYGLGAVVDLSAGADAESRLADLVPQLGALRPRCRQVAEALFSVDSCAARYVALYRDLAS